MSNGINKRSVFNHLDSKFYFELAEDYDGGNKMVLTQPLPKHVKCIAIDEGLFFIYYRRGNCIYVNRGATLMGKLSNPEENAHVINCRFDGKPEPGTPYFEMDSKSPTERIRFEGGKFIRNITKSNDQEN